MVIEIESTEDKKQLEEIAGQIALAIASRDWKRFTALMLEFAEEIKREAIEP